jgi:hypothetical protein
MDDAFIRAHEGVLVSSTLAPPKAAPRQLGDVLILGFDVEWDARSPGRELLSVQLAGLRNGQVVSEVFEPPGPFLTVESFTRLVREFIAQHGLSAPVPKRRPRKVYLVTHFAAAELSKFKDPMGELIIGSIGKATHATTGPIQLGDGEWELEVVDLFAYFAVGLDKVASLVGREKLVVERSDLRRLKEQNKDAFRRYAATDAEIALEAFVQFRAQMRQRWGVDPLLYPSLASVTGAVFRYRYLTTTPGPVMYEEEPCSRKTQQGRWTGTTRKVARFSGNRTIRLAALRAIHGGRVEVFIRGLYPSSLVERDVVSLYPSAARLQPLPHEKTKWVSVTTVDEVHALEGFGKFKFKFPKGTRYPVLPVKGKSMLYPLAGVSNATFAEVRVAMALGAELQVLEAYGFAPGERERNHDVAKYMEALFVEKLAAEPGSLQYRLAKDMMNSFIGKLGQHERSGGLLAIEMESRRAGLQPGVGAAMRHSRLLREAMRAPKPGPLYAPEWACLILGRARALMAELLQKGAVLISTDALVCAADMDFSGPALEALESVGSGFPVKHEADAAFTSRARVYGLLQRVDSIRPGESVLAKDDTWAVVRVARHASIEDKPQFAETLLMCIKAGSADAAPVRKRVRLMSAEEAVREGKHINDEVEEEGRTFFQWDYKRRLKNRDVNPFASWSDTQPYASSQRKLGADHQRQVRKGLARRKVRPISPAKRQHVKKLLTEGMGVRSVARLTGVPKSTVANMKQHLLMAAIRTDTPRLDSGSQSPATTPGRTR